MPSCFPCAHCRYSSSLYHTLLESWGRLGFLWGERFSLDLRMTAVSLLKKVLALEPKVRESEVKKNVPSFSYYLL